MCLAAFYKRHYTLRRYTESDRTEPDSSARPRRNCCCCRLLGVDVVIAAGTTMDNVVTVGYLAVASKPGAPLISHAIELLLRGKVLP